MMAAGIVKHIENSIGILTRCVCDNAGEIPAATIAAFNAWRMAEHEKHMAHLRANPQRYGTDFPEPWFQPPLPVSAGRWTHEGGWTRVPNHAALAMSAGWQPIGGQWEIADTEAPGGRSIMATAQAACALDGIA